MPEKKTKKSSFRCVIYGSYRKYYLEIQRIRRLFLAANIEVLTPSGLPVMETEEDFVYLRGQKGIDRRLIELQVLGHLKQLGKNGFAYFVDPEGYMGRTACYEFGVVQAMDVPYFFMEPPKDLPVYVPRSQTIGAGTLIDFIYTLGKLPDRRSLPKEKEIFQLWRKLVKTYAIVAVGGVVEYVPKSQTREKEILLVKSHKWGGRFAVVGGKMSWRAEYKSSFRKIVKEQTGLSAEIGEHLHTFSPVTLEGFWKPESAPDLFADSVARVVSKKVKLDERAEDFIWLPVEKALKSLSIEPNSRLILELYANRGKGVEGWRE